MYYTHQYDKLLTVNLTKIICFLTADWYMRIKIVVLFWFLPPWRWPHEWPKHVGDYYVINLYLYTQVYFLVVLKNFMLLVNPRDMEK
jgi:hypothetical protein